MNQQIVAAKAAQLASDAAELVEITATATAVVEPQGTTAKIAAIPDGTKAARGGRPLAIINTPYGQRGVFWKGNGKNDSGPTVGVRKIKKNGGLYKPNRYAGTRFYKLSQLQGMGNS